MSYPLLMTGTIDPSKFLSDANNIAVYDTNVRLEQYDNAIRRYIKESCFDKIVFVETSNYPLEIKTYKKLANSYNKEFEFLPFSGNDLKVREKGKSYGEAEAILYAVNNSKLLNNEDTIYKVTGRIFLTNSKKITKTKDACRNEFFSYFKYLDQRCVTYFFKFNKQDYLRYFSNVQDLVDDSNGIDIETVFYRKICRLQVKHKPFKTYPRLTGIIGGLGIAYDKSKLVYFIEDILIKMGMFTIIS